MLCAETMGDYRYPLDDLKKARLESQYMGDNLHGAREHLKSYIVSILPFPVYLFLFFFSSPGILVLFTCVLVLCRILSRAGAGSLAISVLATMIFRAICFKLDILSPLSRGPCRIYK